MMRKAAQHLRVLLAVAFIICTLNMQAQTLEVVSPLIHEGSVAASSCPNDNNGNPCARIIIELPLEDVEVTGAYIMGNVKEKTGRYELFVSVPKKQGQKITLRHSQYNSIDIPLWTAERPLVGREVYRMVVSAPQSATTVTDMHGNQVDLTGNFEVIKHEDLGGQYLVITSEPQEARIYIDGNLVSSGKGSASKMLAYGNHTYRVEAPMYDTEEGHITMGQEKQTLKVALKPAFGFFNITSDPEDGAAVYIDGAKVGFTPYKSQALAEGQHSVRVEKEMYNPVEQTVTIVRSQTLPITLTLIPTFATTTIICEDSDARILIDDREMGKGRWSGRLSEGLHKISARRDSHREIVKTINVVPNNNETVSIEALTPIYGALNVVTEPIGAQVIIDGKAIGETPCIVNNVLTGLRQLTLSLAGYDKVKRTIPIEEGKVQSIELTLESSRSQSVEQQLTDDSGNREEIIWHTIKKGETLYSIAQQYGVSTETILQYNDANIKVGNKLKIVKKGTSRSDLSSNSTSTGSTGSQPKTKKSSSEPSDNVVTSYPVIKSRYVHPIDYEKILAQKEGQKIDLGLPSGTLWRSSNRKWYCDYLSAIKKFNKLWYKMFDADMQTIHDEMLDSDGHFLSKFDFARKTMGREWKTPTLDEFKELITQCKWELVSTRTVYGTKKSLFLITGPSGNYIFMESYGLPGSGTFLTCTPAEGRGLNYYIELNDENILIKTGRVYQSHDVHPVCTKK